MIDVANTFEPPNSGSPKESATMTTTTPVRNVVLVHGGFVDGSGWQSVYDLLVEHGYQVSIVQNPTLSLEDDAAVTTRVLDLQDGSTVLVGHGRSSPKPARTRRWVPCELAAFMADAQVPWGVEALSGAVTEPAWRVKPSWYLVATDDRMIPPPCAAGHVRAGWRDGRRGRW
jgi:hypothetical protein